jgi:hypothetical protein
MPWVLGLGPHVYLPRALERAQLKNQRLSNSNHKLSFVLELNEALATQWW